MIIKWRVYDTRGSCKCEWWSAGSVSWEIAMAMPHRRATNSSHNMAFTTKAGGDGWMNSGWTQVDVGVFGGRTWAFGWNFMSQIIGVSNRTDTSSAPFWVFSVTCIIVSLILFWGICHVTLMINNFSITITLWCSIVLINILVWVCSIMLWGVCQYYIMVYKLTKVNTTDTWH